MAARCSVAAFTPIRLCWYLIANFYMNQQSHQQKLDTDTSDDRFFKARVLAGVIAFSDISVLSVGAVWPSFLFWSLASTGIISFLGIFTLINTTSQDTDFKNGEMRKAITGSFLIFYILVLALFVSSGFGSTESQQSQEIIETVMSPLSTLMGAITLFYFGSRYLDKTQTQNEED